MGTQAARRPWELGVRRTTGGKPGLQVLGRARGGGDPREAIRAPPKEGTGWLPGQTWLPQKHTLCLTVEGPGWGHCAAEIHSPSMDVAAGSPPWTLLEFPQSCHPTTATISITFIPVSRKPACLQKPPRLQNEWPHLPAPARPSCSLPPPGQGFFRPGCPGCCPRTPLLAVTGLSLPWL